MLVEKPSQVMNIFKKEAFITSSKGDKTHAS